jgi:hypothetical protein
MTRAVAPCWPKTFLPAPGCRPLAIEPRRDERVLHVCLRVPNDSQTALAAALRSISSDYIELDWMQTKQAGKSVGDVLCTLARLQRPTLVFIQVQTANILDAGDIARLRPLCAPNCVIMQWDGDQHHPPEAPQRDWFRNLGSGCDVSLICNTQYPLVYDRMGVRCGYLQIGVDADLWKPTTPDPKGPSIVLLASNYAHLKGYTRRIAAARMLTARFPTAFAAYGYGWEMDQRVNGRPFVLHEREAPIYSKALAAVSISIRNDLPRYTSDRLFRCLASGALTLVEAFPDSEGIGLRHGHNCLVWSELRDLEAIVEDVLAHPTEATWSLIRQEARQLAMTHSWDARMHELSAIVEAIRDGGRL